MKRTIFRYPITVENKGWVIFLTLVFFPIGLFLLMLNMRIHIDDDLYYLKYKGSLGWLIFWLIVCFPITFILIILSGVDVEALPT
jgi:hypothetical protein